MSTQLLNQLIDQCKFADESMKVAFACFFDVKKRKQSEYIDFSYLKPALARYYDKLMKTVESYYESGDFSDQDRLTLGLRIADTNTGFMNYLTQLIGQPEGNKEEVL